MSRRPDPQRAKRGTGHRADSTAKTTEIVRQVHEGELAIALSAELPDPARATFMRAVDELGGAGRLRNVDLEALAAMAWALYRHRQAQADIEAFDVLVANPGTDPITRAALRCERRRTLKDSRDQLTLYLRVADKYALTFLSALQAGVLQLAGESMLANLNSSMAEAIVGALVRDATALPQAADVVVRTCAVPGCDETVAGRRKYCSPECKNAARKGRRRR